MDFQKIRRVERADFYLDVAFSRAKKGSKGLVNKKDKYERRLIIAVDFITSSFEKIIFSFPSVDDLSEFHKQLIRLDCDFEQIKQSLGAINWARKTLRSVRSLFIREFRAGSLDIRNAYGRISNILERIDSDLAFLIKARKVLVQLPSIKEDLDVVCIAGFPNVGKTTLLSKLSDSKPEINEYAFTTKSLNVGYYKSGMSVVQLIDTPGTLGREDKMNNIELKAHYALRYVASRVIYVFDLTYSQSKEDQINLFLKIKEYGKEVGVFFSKKDLVSASEINAFESELDIKEIKLVDFLVRS